MRSAMAVLVSLSASFLMACGPVAEPGEDELTAESLELISPVCGDGVCCMEYQSECPIDCPWGDGGMGDRMCYVAW
ncbi:hypothetical protein [Myxococcus hansupus]|nr:hypothetical protein [Myxococcus hansupus]